MTKDDDTPASGTDDFVQSIIRADDIDQVRGGGDDESGPRRNFATKLAEAFSKSGSEEARAQADKFRKEMDNAFPKRNPDDTFMGVTDREELVANIDDRLRYFEDCMAGEVKPGQVRVSIVPLAFHPFGAAEPPAPRNLDAPTASRASRRSCRPRRRHSRRRR